jgi:hypothetical protein
MNATPRPRGYRLCKAIETDKDGHHWSLVYRSWIEDLLNMWRENLYDDGNGTTPGLMVANALRDYCAQTVRLRKERRAFREALEDTIGAPCENYGRWCLTHTTNDCHAAEARKLLGWP